MPARSFMQTRPENTLNRSTSRYRFSYGVAVQSNDRFLRQGVSRKTRLRRAHLALPRGQCTVLETPPKIR